MAMRDLVIHPPTKELRYASGALDELRFRFAEMMERKDVSEAIYQMAKIGRNRALSAKVTVDSYIDDVVKECVAASVDRSPEGGNHEDGCHAKHESTVAASETPNLSPQGHPHD